MNNIIPAGQTYAYDLYKKKIKLPKEKSKVKYLENIVRSKYPNCKDKFIDLSAAPDLTKHPFFNLYFQNALRSYLS